MPIDNINIPLFVYLLCEDIMISDEVVENDNHEDGSTFYDAENANENITNHSNDTENANENITNHSNDIDSGAIMNDNNAPDDVVVANNSNPNNEANVYALVVNTHNNEANDDVDVNDDVVVNNSNDAEQSLNDCVEIVVVTDGSMVKDSTNYTKKKKTNTVSSSSLSSNLQSLSLTPRARKVTPTIFNNTPTKTTAKNSSHSNKRKIDASNQSPKTKKSISIITSPSKQKPPPPTITTKSPPPTIKLPQATEKEYNEKEMRAFERLVIEARKKPELDVDKYELYVEFKSYERLFYQKLFNIIPRTSNKASSAVWKSDYCREIHVTPFGEQYYKSGKK